MLELYLIENFGLSPNDAAIVEESFIPLHLKKGEFFSHAQSRCSKLAFLKSGYLRMFVQLHNKEITQWIVTPNYFVTDLASFVFQTPSRWEIQALEDCELLYIERDQYEQLIKRIPRWPEFDRLFIARCFVFLEERVFSFLSLSAEERYQQLFQQNKEIFNKIPLQYLASMLGMSPETLSRMRNKATK